MFTRVRSTLILLAATAGLSGCVGMDPYGYGSGVSIGYGNGYGYGSPYGYGNYSYGSPYGYGAGYGYGDPYYGWYDDFYYPGAGYYVYNRSGSRYRWSDAQRRYWEQRRGNRQGRENWSGYRTPQSAIQDWADRANGVTTNGGTSTQAVRQNRQYRQEGNVAGRSRGMIVRGDRRAVSDDGASRQQVREARREARSEVRQERSESRSESRGGSWQRAGGGIKVRGDRKAD